jgi:hypothetical protein
MCRRVAILQSNYIPWKGYFDIIRAVDLFVVLDDVQFTKNDWRNRNQVKTAAGPKWLTVPVVTAGRLEQTIDATRIACPWTRRHVETARQAYSRGAGFAAMWPRVAALYEAAAEEPMLARVNAIFLRGLCELLGIATPFVAARDLGGEGRKADRVLALCRAVGAGLYLSGPAASAYLDPATFAAAGIELRFADYSGYPAYPQLHGPFIHQVSVLDLLLNTGLDAPRYMKALL